MWQDGEDRLAGGALDAPDGQPTQADSGVMGMAREAPAAATGALVGELKPKREDERQDELDKRLAVVHELKVSGFVLEITVMVRFSRIRLAVFAMAPPRL